MRSPRTRTFYRRCKHARIFVRSGNSLTCRAPNRFNELRAPETPYDRRKTLLLFIQDFCAIAKNLQTVNRQAFYRALAGNGIIQELPPFFDGPDFMLRMVVVDILQSILDHDATLLRSFVLAQKKHGTRTLTDLMVERLIVDPDDGMKFHCAEILRLFMDSSAADGVGG